MHKFSKNTKYNNVFFFTFNLIPSKINDWRRQIKDIRLKKFGVKIMEDKLIGGRLIVEGGKAGAALAGAVGGMGLVGGFGGISIGAAPVVAAGAVAGSALYGAAKAIEEGDVTALAPVAGGAALGAGISSVVGGMGLAVGGTAIGIGAAPVVAAGAVVGLAAYGFKKLFD
jgi:hypothetical protein